MSSDVAEQHLARLRTRVRGRNGLANLAGWIEENTTINGGPFSFVDHEFQRTIISDTSREVVVRKCSQVGLSEVNARLAIAIVNSIPSTAILTLPSATFGAVFMKTRIDPVINGSDLAKANVHRTNDNATMKQFGDSSYLYVKGAASANAPISIPSDVLIHDEVDFCDQDVLSQYQSRLTHSKIKLKRKFSTPTVPGYGIDLAFQESRRHFNLCKCHHCNHWFMPDYYDHVKVPGYTRDLREITKYALTLCRWQEAAVVCPKCGLLPDLSIAHRQYVVENPDDNYLAAGYQVTPFDAPGFIKPSDLIQARLGYEREQDFVNFNLGLPLEDAEATLVLSDFLELKLPSLNRPGWTVMGVDVGAVYHFVIATVAPDGTFIVVHKEQVPQGLARQRYAELRQHWKVICTVMDSAPHGETVMALQHTDPTMYAAVYVSRKGVTTYKVKDDDEAADEGRSFTRQVDVNRSRAFDDYLRVIRDGQARYVESDIDDEYFTQHTSMKRAKFYDHESGELQYSWQKSDGQDHFHHASVYCHIASKIKGVGRPTVQLPLFTAGAIRLRN